MFLLVQNKFVSRKLFVTLHSLIPFYKYYHWKEDSSTYQSASDLNRLSKQTTITLSMKLIGISCSSGTLHRVTGKHCCDRALYWEGAASSSISTFLWSNLFLTHRRENTTCFLYVFIIADIIQYVPKVYILKNTILYTNKSDL